MESHGLAQSLARALTFLFEESAAEHSIQRCLQHADTWHQLQTLRALLCQRPRVHAHLQARRVRVPVQRALGRSFVGQHLALARRHHRPGRCHGHRQRRKLGLAWVLHAVPSMHRQRHPLRRRPRLRAQCHRLMAHQGRPEPVGSAKVTPGYCAQAQWILHTVGPRLNPGAQPTRQDKQNLASCYKSCLDEAEDLPALEDGRLAVAFPCVSTGLFCFPGRLAAQLAVDAVVSWCKSHPDTPLTHVVFDVFLEKDELYYQEAIDGALDAGTITKYEGEIPESLFHPNPVLETAREWISQADCLLVAAGAGLSAAAGLDFTSQSLFRKQFPAFQRLGLRRLYDTFGWDEWPSTAHKWGFYFTQLQLARTWPASPLYASLLDLATARFDGRFFVRTSNADGFFPANGFPVERFSSPQGAFKYLRCLRNCRPNAYFRSKPYLDAALPLIDPQTQELTDKSKMPVCEYCGGDVFLCVRAGDWSNERPFEEGEERYQDFLDQIEREGKTAVVLELGVGMSTPGVLRWPNEELVRWGEGRVKLIRGGEQAAGIVDFDLEAEGNAIGIEGNINDIVAGLRN